ncbi:MAG: hypothetical protein ACRCWQ_02470 [Bacilli bacterium]
MMRVMKVRPGSTRKKSIKRRIRNHLSDQVIFQDVFMDLLMEASNGRVDKATAKNIAKIVGRSIDFNDPLQAHKSVNWYVNDIIERYSL